MTFFLKNRHLSIGLITDQYADVYLHVEENSVHSLIKANKVILAFHSPYFHRVFQSRENIQTVDMGFVGVKTSVIRDAVKMIYGQSIEVLEKHIGRFSAFVKLLELDFEKSESYEGTESSLNSKKMKMASINASVTDLCETENETLETKRNSERCIENVPQMLKTSEAVPLQTTTTCSVPLPATSSSLPASTTSSSEAKTTSTDILSSGGAGALPATSSVSMPRTFPTDTVRNVCPDNWTETPESGLEEQLRDIDFKVGISVFGHHKDYICCNCGVAIKALVHAKTHFIDKHQNSEKEKKTITEIMELKKAAVAEIQKLQVEIQKGGNRILVISQLKTIIENLREYTETLNNLENKNLPPNLMRKRMDIIKSIVNIVTKAETYIDAL